MNNLFEPLDKNRITTGLLSNYGLQFIDPEYYNGTLQDSNEVDILVWKSFMLGVLGCTAVWTEAQFCNSCLSFRATLLHHEQNTKLQYGCIEQKSCCA